MNTVGGLGYPIELPSKYPRRPLQLVAERCRADRSLSRLFLHTGGN